MGEATSISLAIQLSRRLQDTDSSRHGASKRALQSAHLHGLVVELEALELDDERGGQLAEADALLSVHLLARVELVLILALEPLAVDELLQPLRDRRVALDLGLREVWVRVER